MSFLRSLLLIKSVNLFFFESMETVGYIYFPITLATDVFFDREKELAYFSILSDNHFGISLVKSFPGGRLEKWRDGYDVSFSSLFLLNSLCLLLK